LLLALPADVKRAEKAVGSLLAERRGAELQAQAAAAAVHVARWVCKRALRSGMELAASGGGHDGFSRDLLACHRAIGRHNFAGAAAEVGAEAAAEAEALSLLVLQLACAPTPTDAAAAASLAEAMLAATAELAHLLEGDHLRSHFSPLLSPTQLLPAPPMPAAAAARPAGARPTAPRRPAAAAAAAAADATPIVSDALPPLTIGRRRAVLSVRAGDARGEAIAARALRRRPVVLRGAAAAWAAEAGLRMPPSLDDLAELVPSGLVRLADGPTFTFVKEGHPLVRTGRYPPPSRTVRMSGAAFAARLRAGGAPPPPVAYRSGRERAYLQAELPPSWAARLSVPPLWRSVGVAQAQAMRLWVSAEGAVSPAHFDNAASFLAQIHGRKRLLFFPPAAISDLYPYPTDHPLARRSRVDLYADAEARARRFPRFAAAAAACQEVVLDAGDCVLFPPFWFHHVETLDPGPSWSLGCRYTV